ncbi:MAG: hypothetical protein AAGI07_11225 [Bacteroidota bacterium]
MVNHLKTPSNSLAYRQDKYKHFKSQMEIVFAAFMASPKTMLMVSRDTGVMRASVCRFVAAWEKTDKIKKIRTGICPITKYPTVGFYTTNPKLFPTNKMLNDDCKSENRKA